MRKKLFSKRKLLQKALPLFMSAALLMLPQAEAATYTVNNVNGLLATLNSASYGDTVLLTNNGSNWVLPYSMAVTGNGGFTLDGGSVIVLGTSSFRLIDMSGRNINSINNIELSRGSASGDGGALTVNQLMGSIYNSAFRNNAATGSGGAIYVANDFLGDIRTNIHFDSNRANGGSGGGLYIGTNFNGSIVGQNGDVHFDNNYASQDGGGMYVGGSFNNGQITATYFATNSAGQDGGGLFVRNNFGGSLGAYSFFINNTAGRNGAGMFTGGDFNGPINGARVTGNNAGGSGGGIYITGNINSTITADFANNVAAVNGGALYVGRDFNANLSGGTFISNQATGDGGAIYSGQNMNNQWQNTSFQTNTAANGGAVYAAGTINSSMSNLTFSGNKATGGSGGALYTGGYLAGNTSGGTFSNNTATTSGGAVYIGQELNGGFQNTQFTSNSAGSGGAIYANSNANGYFNSTTFTGNKATSGDGGAIAAANDLRSSFSGSNFSGNNATGGGGALYAAANLTGSIQNTNFTSNSAAQGGAIYARNLNSNISGGTISNNTASGLGGGIYVAENFNMNVSGGATTTIRDNTDSSGPNGIAFAGGGRTANFNIDGQLVMYDPVSSAGSVDVTQKGSGMFVLGGNSVMGAGSTWSVDSGTMRLTFDSKGNSFSLSGIESFMLEAGSILEIVPYATPAQILVNPGGTVDLNGRVHLASDHRYAPQITLTENTIFLHLNVPHLDQGLIDQTSGKFSLGQYDYAYDGIVWIHNDTDIGFRQLESWVSPDRSGGNNADGSMNVSVANDTSKQIFDHLDDTTEVHKNLWGTTFYNVTRNDAKNRSIASKIQVPGFIIGQDFELGERSYMGGAISAAWPTYKQGGFKDKGYDVRFNVYGATYFGNDWKFGWLASAGFGNLKHTRYIGSEELSEKRDITNYILGISLSKEFEYRPKNILRPFGTYEYIKAKAKGFEENGHYDYAIGTSSINADIFRLRTGLEYIRRFTGDSAFKFRLYYHGLFGATRPQGTSYMLSQSGETVTMIGAGLERNALGTGLTYTRAFNERSSLSLNYDGIFASKSTSNNFSLTYEYKF